MSAQLTTTTLNPSFMSNAAKTLEGVQSLSEIMAKCATLPKHLQGKPSDCFRIVVQAGKWGMDPFAVAECTSVVHGKLCYEGKLVNAVLHSMGAIEGRLEYEIEGKGEGASITVIGTPKGSKKAVSLGGTVKQWRTRSSAWDTDPESMLVYRGTRQWARLYAPEALLGVYTPDEIRPFEPVETQAEVVASEPAEQREIPQVEPDSVIEEDSLQDQCVAVAKRLFETDQGKAALYKCLEKFGIKNVKNVPAEQQQDLLSALMIAEATDAAVQ